MPIFMIGIQRSGSNLLRLMLNQLSEIAAPHPPHIMQRMAPLVPSYGNLEDGKNFARLVEDVCQLVELNPVPWEGVVLDRKDVARRCRKHSLVAVFGAVYDIMSEHKGARTWLCKSLANIQYLDAIEDYYGKDARYLYLYRDGRDVALSFRKAVVGEKHFYFIAKEWTQAQRLALDLRGRVDSERFCGVSYEELTGNAEATMRRLCKFIGVEYSPQMLEFHESDEAQRAAKSSDLWGNVTKPVMADNTHKFLKECSAEDVGIFESVAGDVLDALGYKRFYVKKGQETKFSDADIRGFAEENARLKQAVLSKTDPEDLKRRDRQAALIESIKARGAGIAARG